MLLQKKNIDLRRRENFNRFNFKRNLLVKKNSSDSKRPNELDKNFRQNSMKKRVHKS